MEYIIFKWGDSKYSSASSDVIWKARISWGEMEYNITRWSDLEDFPYSNSMSVDKKDIAGKISKGESTDTAQETTFCRIKEVVNSFLKKKQLNRQEKKLFRIFWLGSRVAYTRLFLNSSSSVNLSRCGNVQHWRASSFNVDTSWL